MTHPLRSRLRTLLLATVVLHAGLQAGRCQSSKDSSAAQKGKTAQLSPSGTASASGLSSQRTATYSQYDDYELYTKGYAEDHDAGLYFNPSSGTMDDVYGDYFFGMPEEHSSCKLDAKGKPTLDGAYAKMCDIQVTGANKQVPMMPGGLDGIYKLHTCENSRPAFLRKNSPPGEDRLLWYFEKHKDWDISNGTAPQPDDVLLYGGEGGADLRPEFVAKDRWFIAADFQDPDTATAQADYLKANVVLQCTNKQRAQPAPSKSPAAVQREVQRPYITDEEWDKQLRSVITPAARAHAEASKGVNMVLIAVLVVLGVGILACIPRCLASGRVGRQRRGDGAGGWIGMTQLVSSQRVAAD